MEYVVSRTSVTLRLDHVVTSTLTYAPSHTPTSLLLEGQQDVGSTRKDVDTGTHPNDI